MLYVFDKQTRSIVGCDEVEFKSQGIQERQDIEKWIEDNPEILGEDLLVVAKEYDGFDKTDERLDLLAMDRAGNLVIIELKRDGSGRAAELQALKYAAYCSTLTIDKLDNIYLAYLRRSGEVLDCRMAHRRMEEFSGGQLNKLDAFPRIILVAKEFRPEVTATVIWLRKAKLDIRCVKLTPYLLESSKLGITSTVLIPQRETEEFIIQAEMKDANDGTLSRGQEEYRLFYQDLRREIEKRLKLQLSEPEGRSYYQIPTLISGVHFEWGFHGRPRATFGVELHFERGNKSFNQAALKHFVLMKAEITRATEEDVQFLSEWGRTWARLYVERRADEVTQELRDWAISKMESLHRLLNPEIVKLKPLLSSASKTIDS